MFLLTLCGVWIVDEFRTAKTKMSKRLMKSENFYQIDKSHSRNLQSNDWIMDIPCGISHPTDFIEPRRVHLSSFFCFSNHRMNVFLTRHADRITGSLESRMMIFISQTGEEIINHCGLISFSPAFARMQRTPFSLDSVVKWDRWARLFYWSMNIIGFVRLRSTVSALSYLIPLVAMTTTTTTPPVQWQWKLHQ